MKGGVGLCILLFSAVIAGAQKPAPANLAKASGDNKYVGSRACQDCHSDITDTFYRNPHNKSIVSQKEPPERTGCEGCHGPGGQHIAAGDGGSIIAFPRIPKEQVLDTCLQCHSQTLSRANIRRSSHTVNGIVCTNCHSIHSSPAPKNLLAKTQTNLCSGCHTNVRAQFSLPFKHRVNEGFMNCTDCHNPHGAFQPTWANATRPRHVEQSKTNEESCINCHADKRGPFVFEHSPVRVDGCLSCHVPHGSTNSRMLTRPVVFTLCLECHNGAGNLGRQANGVKVQAPAPHNMANPTFQNCTQCHVRIHGSNADLRYFR
jgi:DmsE family decaheme c-type cytochrome